MPPRRILKMPSKKRTSMTYPSDNGSQVSRSSSFSSWPTLASSVAGSDQSMAANTSEPDCDGLRVIAEYPSESCHYTILEDFSEWYAEDGNLDLAAVEAALDRITAVMQEHRLFLDVVTFPTRCDKAEWTLWMDGDLLIGKGEAAVQEEILCSAFFSGQKNVLKHTGYYPGPRGD